jgi:uncharacterized metal-binding protein
MASGRAHDRATAWLALPFGLLCGLPLGWEGVLVGTGSFLVGGLWLSPDLDTRSNATRRWGALALLWWPYRRLLSHRSALSHTPLLGSAGRLLYLAAVVALLSQLLQPLGTPPAGRVVESLRTLVERRPPLLLTALAGLEASSWLHLLQDGDPWPRVPRPLRWLRRLGPARGRGGRVRRPRGR